MEISTTGLERVEVELVDSLVDLAEEGVEVNVKFFDVFAIMG